jgi:YidC/Oxa1 family membrane protein insertase
MNFFSAFLKDILDLINGFVGSYGWSVILFTLLIRLVLMPLDVKSRQSMKRMNEVQPQLNALQKKYANDKEKLNIKMNELYKKEKINPLSGCLPMLIQLPILFTMFTAMRVVANEHTVKMLLAMKDNLFTVDMLQPFLWIKSIYQPDSFLSTIIPAIGDPLSAIQAVSGTILTEENLTIVREFLNSSQYAQIAQQFGASTYQYSAPMMFWTISIPAQFNGLFILPLLAGASQMLSSKLLTPNTAASGAASDSQQQTNKMMQWFFPFFSIWICATSTSAFALYWVFINVLQIIQQYFINMYFDKKKSKTKLEEEVIKP